MGSSIDTSREFQNLVQGEWSKREEIMSGKKNALKMQYSSVKQHSVPLEAMGMQSRWQGENVAAVAKKQPSRDPNSLPTMPASMTLDALGMPTPYWQTDDISNRIKKHLTAKENNDNEPPSTIPLEALSMVTTCWTSNKEVSDKKDSVAQENNPENTSSNEPIEAMSIVTTCWQEDEEAGPSSQHVKYENSSAGHQ